MVISDVIVGPEAYVIVSVSPVTGNVDTPWSRDLVIVDIRSFRAVTPGETRESDVYITT